jgi:P27 family predicted phage terminase small subunit
VAKGRPRDPKRARRQTGNRAKPGELRVLRPKAQGYVEVFEDPEPPADIPERAQEIWRALVPDLHPQYRKAADLEALRMLCVSAERSRQATETIATYGLIVEGLRGPIVNPALKVERDAAGLYLKLAEQLGLTMAARLRLGLVLAQGASLAAQLSDELGAD